MMRLNRVLLFPLLVLYLHSGPLAGQGLVNEPDSTPLAVVPEDTATDSFRKALDPVLAAQVVELVNQQRLNNGNLPPLKIDTLLTGVAEAHSQAMAERDFFSHCDPDTGTGSSDRATAAGYNWNTVGENIAAGQSTPADVMSAWMNSPGHRANILNGNYRELGVGFFLQSDDQATVRVQADANCNHAATDGPFRRYWTQVFGARSDVLPVIINREQIETGDPSVSLYLHGEGWAQEMRLRNDNGSFGPWQPFQSTLAWTLTALDGTRSVTVELRRDATVRSASDSILLTGQAGAMGELAVSVVTASQDEGDSGSTLYTVRVSRSNDTSASATVDWAVSGSGSDPADAADFLGGMLPGGSLSFAPGDSLQEFTVAVAGDTTVEADEGFTVTLGNPVNASITTATASTLIQNDDTAPPPTGSSTDLALATASYLGGGGSDEGNAVVIQSGGEVVVGGLFSGLPAAATDRTLLGASATAPGIVLHFNTDGSVLQSITRLGGTVDDLDLDPRNDRIAVVGDFGLAVLSADGASVIWSASGNGIGDGGAAVYSRGRRVAVGSDGTVAAIFNGYVYLFDENGTSLGARFPFGETGVLVGGGLYGNRAEDIAVDGANRRVFTCGWSQTSANAQTPWIYAHRYDAANYGVEAWRDYRWWASALLNTSLLADSRCKRISRGEDGALYLIGNTDGGNTVFQRNPKYLDASNNRGADVISQTVNNIQIDRWNNGAGASVGAFAYFARINGSDGELPVAQFQYSSAGINQARSFRVEAITADTGGNTYIGGQSSSEMPERGALTINGSAIGPRVANETSLIGVAADFASRVQVASFTANGGGAGAITALASRNGKLAILGTTDGPIVTVSPLDGTLNGSDVFLAVTGTAAPLPAGFTVNPTGGLGVSETGTTAGFSVVLTSQPASNVSFGIASSDTGEASVLPATLTFTPDNWNTAQNVTVSGVDDTEVDGNQSATISVTVTADSDPAYIGLAPRTVTVTVTDDDVTPTPGGITVTPDTGLVVGEDGSSASFDVLLDSEPSAEVIIALSSSNPAEGSVDPTSLSFGPADWMMARSVTVTGVDDDTVDGDVAFSILTAPAQSTDSAYAGLDAVDVAVINRDNDATDPVTPGITLGEPGTFSDDGSTLSASFTVVLDAPPDGNVVFDVTSDDPMASISSNPLTFTPDNWDQPQTVSVVLSSGATAPVTVTLAVNTAASVASYHDMAPRNVVLTPPGVAAPVAIPTLRHGGLLLILLLLTGLWEMATRRTRA